MNKKILTLALFSFLLAACGESSNASDSFNANSVEAGDSSSSEKNLVLDDSALLECEKSLQSPSGDDLPISQKTSKDTVCFYEDFVVKDTICCFGESASWLKRNEFGEYRLFTGDYRVVFAYDTLSPSVDPSTIHRCMATVGNGRYKAVQIGSQTWLSENVRGEGHCLNDEEKNCNIFGTMMSYDKAKEACSGDYRLPTSADVENLLNAVGGIVETTNNKGVCGESLGGIRYFDVPLFTSISDSSKNNNTFGFSFPMDGGRYDKGVLGKDMVYWTDMTCFFLQSDENANYRNVFCYDNGKKNAVVAMLEKDAELYVRCIMK